MNFQLKISQLTFNYKIFSRANFGLKKLEKKFLKY